MINTCQYCGKEFKARKKKQKYCNTECQWNSQIKHPKEKCYCLVCNKEFTRGRETKGMYCSKECQWESMRVPKEVREARLKEKQRQQLLFKPIKDNRKRLKQLENRLIKAYKEIQSRIRQCDYCGKEYIQRNLAHYCSNECRKKYNNRQRWEYKDKRIYKNGIPDKTITLQKLYERDKGICQLCGNHTDFTDYVLDDKGNFIVGYSYPSIDHIQPISKGRNSSME